MIVALSLALLSTCMTLPFVLWKLAEERARVYDDGYTAGWDDAVWHSQMYK